jgi:SHS2 domain-containing protein
VPFEFLDDIAPADIAFHAAGRTLEELFCAAAEAVLNAAVDDTESVSAVVRRDLHLTAATPEMLLFRTLEELIYHKDAEQLLLHLTDVHIDETDGEVRLQAVMAGETIDPGRHELMSDLKAVTWHRFSLRRAGEGWEATVVIDV